MLYSMTMVRWDSDADFFLFLGLLFFTISTHNFGVVFSEIAA